MNRATRWLIVLLVVATAAVLALVYTSRTARAAAIVVMGRASGCPIDHAIDAHRQEKREEQAKDRLLAASKLVDTDAQGFELWDTPRGRFWIPKGNQFVLPFNLAELETHIYGTGDLYIHQGDVVLDCGASDGDFVKDALAAGAGKVVAIEISPKNVECLRRNLAAEIAAGKAVVYPKGVWDKDDTLELNEDDSNFAADSVVMMQPKSKKSGVMVALTTIDKMVAELKLDRVDYIKMDIEGAEPKALEGGRQTIARFHPRMGLSVYHQHDHPVLIPQIVKSMWDGYKISYAYCEEEKDNFRIHPQVMIFHQ
jgi:FkbM family methyltransferase